MPTLISWNTQGDGMSRLSGARSELFSKREDNDIKRDHIIMVQEFGNPNQFGNQIMRDGAIIHATESYGRDDFDRRNFRVFLVEQTDTNYKRCTTALFIEDGYEVLECNIFPKNYSINDVSFKRPVLYCRCKYNNIEYIIGTVHLTAYAPVAKRQLNEIYGAFESLYRGDKWIIMGDFNCPPEIFDPKPLPNTADLPNASDDSFNISTTDSPTQWSGNRLDYAIFSDSLKGQIHVKKGGASGSCRIPSNSDHWPIHCIF